MFPRTQWSRIEAAGSTAARAQTLADLARAYRAPLLAVARRRGLPPDAAEDVVQELFARFVERDVVRVLDRERGRLRSFLCVALERLIAHHRERARAHQRGGGIGAAPLGDDLAADAEPPELAFDRAWRAAVLERAFARLAAEHRRGPFEVVLAYFRGDDPAPLAELAERHGTTVAALKSLLHRARGRFRGIVRDEVAATIGPLADLDAELRALAL